MQMHDILRQLKRYDGKFQRKAVQAAIANQEQITPELRHCIIFCVIGMDERS
jgi:hypothetical protein